MIYGLCDMIWYTSCIRTARRQQVSKQYLNSIMKCVCAHVL